MSKYYGITHTAGEYKHQEMSYVGIEREECEDIILDSTSSKTSISIYTETENMLPPWKVIAQTINYLLGTGFLVLPWAFYTCGLAYGISILFIITLLSVQSTRFVLESVEIGYNLQCDQLNVEIDLKQVEMSKLFKLFLGKCGNTIYLVAVTASTYSCLWALSTVFANSMTSLISCGEYSYYIYLFIFSCLVVPICCYDVTEQINFQLLLTFARMIMIILMLISIIIFPNYFNINKDNITYPYNNNNVYSNINALSIMLPLSTYANVFHPSIPNMAVPLIKYYDNQINTNKLWGIFSIGIFICFTVYFILGIVLTNVFNEHILPSSHLHWIDFGNSHKRNVYGYFLRCISIYVLLFPAIDVLSVYPLNSITLGNSFYMSLFPSSQSNHTPHTTSDNIKPNYLCTSYCTMHKILCRLLASAPPIIGAAFVSDLGIISQFAGTTAFILVFIFPSVLLYYGRMKSTSGTKLKVSDHGNQDAINNPMFEFRNGNVFSIIISSDSIISDIDVATVEETSLDRDNDSYTREPQVHFLKYFTTIRFMIYSIINEVISSGKIYIVFFSGLVMFLFVFVVLCMETY